MHSRIRIAGGEHRSRYLEAPPGFDGTRPMTGRVKESIFSILRGWFEGATVLDLFAGVGTMGLEAVSHGAARVVMVERDEDVMRFAERNIGMLGCGDRCTVIQADALSSALLQRVPTPVDVIFLDPPYDLAEQQSGRRRILEQAARLRSLFANKGWLVLRLPYKLEGEEAVLPGFIGPEMRTYGEMHVHLYTPEAA